MCDKQHVQGLAVYSEHHMDGNGTARISRKRTRLSGKEAAWTASRCNRILRTIDSRIAILARTSNNGSSKTSGRNVVKQTPGSSVWTSTNEAQDEGKSSDVETPITEDPEWLPRPRAGTKKPWKTYTAKHRQRLSIHERHGKRRELCFSTPFVKRVLRPGGELEHVEQLETETSTTDFAHDHRLPKRPRQLPIKPTSVTDEAQRNLQSAFQSMLVQTQPKIAQPRTGSRSLMSTCLRKVPSYVQLLDEDALECNTIATGDRDVGNNTYNVYMDLEGLGSSGWPYLREVVRAHCVQVLCENIACGVLPIHFINHLVDTCIATQAVAEGQKILEALLEVRADSRTDTSPNHAEDRFCFTKIRDFALRTSSDGFEMRSISHLLNSGSSNDTIGTLDTSSYWNSLVQALLQPASFGDAAIALQNLTLSVLKALSGVNMTTQQHFKAQGAMLYSTVILIGAILISGLIEETGSPVCRRLEEILKQVYFSIHTHPREFNIVQRSKRASKVLNALMMSIVLADLMQSSSSSHLMTVSVERTLDCLAATRGSPGKHDEPFDAIGDIARCMTRFDEASGRTMWKHMINSLLTSCDIVSAHQLHVVQGLALESAEHFDATYHHSGESSFAAEVECGIRQHIKGTASRTPLPKCVGSGFRWDAGLCEFVARTPFPILSDASDSRESLQLDSEARARQGQDQCPTGVSSCEHRAGKVPSRTALIVISPNVQKLYSVRASDSPKVSPQGEISRTGDCKTNVSRPTRKRSSVEAQLDLEVENKEAQLDGERDELGIPTPAVKKKRRQAMKTPVLASKLKHGGSRVRASSGPVIGSHTTSSIDLSDDELGV